MPLQGSLIHFLTHILNEHFFRLLEKYDRVSCEPAHKRDKGCPETVSDLLVLRNDSRSHWSVHDSGNRGRVHLLLVSDCRRVRRGTVRTDRRRYDRTHGYIWRCRSIGRRRYVVSGQAAIEIRVFILVILRKRIISTIFVHDGGTCTADSKHLPGSEPCVA